MDTIHVCFLVPSVWSGPRRGKILPSAICSNTPPHSPQLATVKNLRPFVLLAILSYAFGLLIQIMNNTHCSILNVEYRLEETIFTDPADECVWGKTLGKMLLNILIWGMVSCN